KEVAYLASREAEEPSSKGLPFDFFRCPFAVKAWCFREMLFHSAPQGLFLSRARAEENCPEAHHSRPFLHRDAVILGGPHGKAVPAPRVMAVKNLFGTLEKGTASLDGKQ